MHWWTNKQIQWMKNNEQITYKTTQRHLGFTEIYLIQTGNAKSHNTIEGESWNLTQSTCQAGNFSKCLCTFVLSIKPVPFQLCIFFFDYCFVLLCSCGGTWSQNNDKQETGKCVSHVVAWIHTPLSPRVINGGKYGSEQLYWAWTIIWMQSSQSNMALVTASHR